MRRKIRAVMTLAVSIVSVSCIASDWQEAARADNVVYELDFNSFASVATYRKAWVQFTYFDGGMETDSYPKKKYQSGKALYYFDCGGKTLGAFQHVLYADVLGGAVVESRSQKFDPKLLSDVVPDTIGESLHRVACSSVADRVKLKARNEAARDAFEKRVAKLRAEQAQATGK